jgi:nitrate reductase gamma subunit
VFIAMHSQLRRHRRKATACMAVLAVAAVAMTAHSALMAGSGDHMSGAATICLTIGGCVAVIGVAAFAVRRLLQHPLWLISPPLAPTLPFIPVASGCLVRAGHPSLSQVFRL